MKSAGIWRWNAGSVQAKRSSFKYQSERERETNFFYDWKESDGAVNVECWDRIKFKCQMKWEWGKKSKACWQWQFYLFSRSFLYAEHVCCCFCIIQRLKWNKGENKFKTIRSYKYFFQHNLLCVSFMCCEKNAKDWIKKNRKSQSKY